ncbi:MAG: d-galactonate transporter [Firmicutes bacterium]|nr:d-galactonate transporter [Bacillota bacterium]
MDNKRWWLTVPFIAMILTYLTFMAAMMGWIPLLPIVKQAFNMNFTEIGMFAGVTGIATVIMSVPAGWATKRFGEKKIFVAGGIGVVAGLLILSQAQTFSVAMTGRTLWVFAYRLAVPAMMACATFIIASKYRATAYGILGGFSTLAAVLGINAGAVLEHSFGWRYAMFAFVGFTAFAMIMVGFFYKRLLDPSKEMQEVQRIEDKSGEKPRNVYLMPAVWALGLLVLFSSEEGLMDSFGVLQMKELWGTTPIQFTQILTIGLVLSFIVNIVGGWAADRYGRWNMLILIGLFNTIAGVCIIIGQHDMYGVYYVGLLLAKAFQFIVPNILMAVAGSMNQGRDVGPIIGIVLFGSGFAQFFAPQVLGILRDMTHGYNAGWIFVAGCSVASLLIAAAFKFYYAKPEKNAPTQAV